MDVEIDPVTSEHVKTIFNLYANEHYGTRLVAKYLNDRDILTPTGTLWNSSLVCKVLRCKTYIGIYVLHKFTKNKPQIESPVMPHLVIIDLDIWQRVQELLDKTTSRERTRPPTRHGGLLLTGLMYCKQCGKKITSLYSYSSREIDKPKEERTRRYYYRCTTDQKPKEGIPKCKPFMWSAEIAEGTVISHAKEFILQIDKDRLIADHESAAEERMTEAVRRVEKAESDLAKNEREVKKLKEEIMRALLGESTFSQTVLSEMLKGKEAEGIDLMGKYEEAQNRVLEIDQELTAQKAVFEDYTDWSARFDASATADKKAMLLNIIDRIDAYDDKFDVTFKVKINISNITGQVTPLNPAPAVVGERGGDSMVDASICAVKGYHYPRTAESN